MGRFPALATPLPVTPLAPLAPLAPCAGFPSFSALSTFASFAVGATSSPCASGHTGDRAGASSGLARDRGGTTGGSGVDLHAGVCSTGRRRDRIGSKGSSLAIFKECQSGKYGVRDGAGTHFDVRFERFG